MYFVILILLVILFVGSMVFNILDTMVVISYNVVISGVLLASMVIGFEPTIESKKSTILNIEHVERRFDGTTHVYVSNVVQDVLVAVLIPDGIDRLTDDQILENVKVDCTTGVIKRFYGHKKTNDVYTLTY